MAQSQAGEKTEKPSPKRKKDARKDGQIPRSNDIGGWLMLLTTAWLMPMVVRSGFEQLRGMLTSIQQVLDGGEGELIGFFGDAILGGTLVMAPPVLLAMLLGVGSQVAQIGWAPKKMKPDFKKLNPFKGIKQMVGMRAAWETVKNLLKLAAIVIVSVGPITTIYETLVASGSTMNVPAVAGLIAESTLGVLRNVSIIGLAIAAADYLQSKKQIDKQIKMTKQEVKEENKQNEGDPMVKGQIRQRQMAMSRNRMMAAVPDADVIIVNPTHIAVAMRYDPTAGAPKVLAKGAGAVADRIRELADESHIPIVRDIPLARTVYRLVEIDQQIPVELYEAVARVLAFVYALRAKGRAAGTHESPFATAHEPLTALEKPRRGAVPSSELVPT
ncbi:flagellar biosynthesis protein FlhB [Euzebya sp.]|uniref:EscU/YscU/HrcU family type III secretion system export apparatus switch protein n=1 Tax=Euzebya sp. TaxID=1971409 RepID=UPI00351651ED